MIRKQPAPKLNGIPCSIVAVSCALGEIPSIDTLSLKKDGYATLSEANKFIRNNLSVKKRINYKRGQRPLLKDLNLDGKAIVCVYGHFLYVDHNTYWSFFDNEEDEVVAVWLI